MVIPKSEMVNDSSLESTRAAMAAAIVGVVLSSVTTCFLIIMVERVETTIAVYYSEFQCLFSNVIQFLIMEPNNCKMFHNDITFITVNNRKILHICSVFSEMFVVLKLI